MENFILVEGASENNLKAINVKIPHNCITLICGPSGSGKTTLAIDVVHAESQRSYFQTFSSYARQFLERIARPKALRVENLKCSMCIKQGRSVKNNRSTVGSFLGILDHLKVLFTNFADYVCPHCNSKIQSREPITIAKEALELAKRSKGFVCGSVEVLADWDHQRENLLNRGFFRALVDNQVVLLENVEAHNICSATSDENKKELLIVIERFGSTSKIEQLKKAIEITFSEFDNKCVIVTEDGRFEYSRVDTCACGKTAIERSENLFDASSSFGACPRCKGFGYTLDIDENKLIDPSKPILKGGLIPLSFENFSHERVQIRKLLKEYEGCRWNELPESLRKEILENPTFGLLARFGKLERKKYLPHIRALLSRFRTEVQCSSCFGTGISDQALNFKLEGFSIYDLFTLEIDQILDEFIPRIKRFENLGEELKLIISNLEAKLRTVSDLKIGHLKFQRKLKTLSGGEFQRLNISAALGNPLSGLQYILDEPSSGLHHEDNDLLGEKLKQLASKGNTVIVIEHDPYFLKLADYVVHLGPGSGSKGGQIVFSGPPSELKSDPFEKPPFNRSSRTVEEFSEFEGLTGNNIINQSVRIAERLFNVICGVSGSGKSTLLRILEGRLNAKSNQAIMIDQKFVSKNARSTVASYISVWNLIRDEFQRRSGISRSFFSFNVASEGRCDECKGLGYKIEDLQFLPDVKLICPSCEGKRFAQFILEQKICNKNIAEILDLTIDEASECFEFLRQSLQLAQALGLGHLRLGQTLSEVSVGEAQRLKILRWMRDESRSQYILFDEPTCGLHPQEVVKLLELIDQLTRQGKTVIVAEHHLDLIKNADHIIELGEGSGKNGGRVIFQGSFEQLMRQKSRTAEVFKKPKMLKTSVPTTESDKWLQVVRCQHRNLDISNLKIPYGKFVCVTGPSGAGKSSLVFETIAAEAERLFLANLSPYTLSFLDVLPKPSGAIVNNLKPVLRLEQYFAIPSSLSSVGTLTDILSYIRLLYAKRGEQLCPKHKAVLRETSVNEIVSAIKDLQDRILVCGVLVSGRKGSFGDLLSVIESSPAEGALVDGVFMSRYLCSLRKLDKNKQHYIDVVTAIVQPNRVSEDLLADAITEALKFNTKVIKIFNPETKKFKLYNLDKTCPECGFSTRALDPQDFSFSSTRGRCTECEGTGHKDGEPCSNCKGSGLNEQALSVKFNGLNIAELSALKLTDLLSFLQKTSKDDEVVRGIIEEVTPKVRSLIELGLGYLSLNRRLETLSSGELQRVRLSTLLTTGLRDVLLILDEPTASLHPSEVNLVMNKIKEQIDKGNSVIMVEHDRNAIESSDYIIELGPGGGREGGKVVFEGNLDEFKTCSTLTAKALRSSVSQEVSVSACSSEFIEIKYSNVNNLKIRGLRIPLNQIVVICGKSGSGKSSLAKGTIYAGLYGPKTDKFKILFPDSLREAVYIDQTLISKNSRSTPATYLKIFDEIRILFAQTAQARALGLKSSSFSFNSKQFCCKVCLGLGYTTYQIGFLREDRVTCSECKGARFRKEVLEARFKGLNISEVLNLTFNEAFKFFSDIKKISRVIQHVIDIGLGYLTLGQPLSSLSGGENQRLKLVKYFIGSHKARMLFILDEPTLGLHISDVGRLISKLRGLVNKGHSVIIVEHDETVINSADYIIELGPGSGDEGGEIIFTGVNPSRVSSVSFHSDTTKTPFQEAP